MSQPKALLCLLGEKPMEYAQAEAEMQKAGFATVCLRWHEISNQNAGFAELAGILNEPVLSAWVIVGSAHDFTPEVLGNISLISLSLTRTPMPNTIFAIAGTIPEEIIPTSMTHIKTYALNSPFAAKLMAARIKKGKELLRPFHIATHLDPFIGTWLEIGPKPDAIWKGFMVGLATPKGTKQIDIIAFGVGPKGVLPNRSMLEHPLRGIQGEYGEMQFIACAAKNTLNNTDSCYIKIESIPHALLLGSYPNEEPTEEMESILFTLV